MVLKSWLLILFLLKAPLAWGFSVERTENYLRIAHARHLEKDPQWIRLGHYHSDLFGRLSSKIRGSFFLNPAGDHDPGAELESTLRVLFSEHPGPPPQCHYLARMRWLKKVLPLDPRDVLACPLRDQWKTKLNAQEAYLIFASSDLSSAASSFGHTFLRLHDPDHPGALDMIDYAVNFAARTDDSDGVLFALKGLFGMYPGFYTMMPYHQKIKDYINLEGRDIWEYKMNLSPDQVAMMLDHLLELEGSYIPYYFVDDNCSYEILELLEVVRPDLDLTSHFHDVTIPLDTLKILAAQPGFLSGEKKRPSLQSEFQKQYLGLNSTEKYRLAGIMRNKNSDGETDPRVLDAALSYLSIQEYREGHEQKDRRYQLALQRARLGVASEDPPESSRASPLESPDSSAFYLGSGTLDRKAVSRLKWRRAFHDLISRDDGVSPFSHMEVLSLEFQYEYEARRLNLDHLQLLKIISTNPVTRLDHPLSWKTSWGTEPQLAPFAEAGLGYSFDFALGANSRWIFLGAARAYQFQEKAALGVGAESLFVQKWSRRWRSLEEVKYLGGIKSKVWFSSRLALSHDLTRKLELRLSYEHKRDEDLYLASLVF